MTQKASDSSRFILRGANRERLEEAVRRSQDLEIVEETSEVLVVELASGERDEKSAWESLRALVGDDLVILPVHEGERSQSLYPTGAIQVRFAAEPSSDDLTDFADRHRIRVIQRNRFQPSQVRFEPADPAATYLPEVVESLRSSAGVRRVWEETEARYTRGRR